jgi:hypothetical protein
MSYSGLIEPSCGKEAVQVDGSVRHAPRRLVLVF